MDLKELKLIYNKYAQNYSLPDFEVLDKEFQIKDITNENIVLQEIRDKILDQLEHYMKILEGIVQPETTLVDMYESKVFSDEEKIEIFKLYKRFMFMDRYSLETALEDGDRKVAEFINVVYREWISLKPKILEVIIHLKESWTKDDDKETTVEYCG